MLPLQLPPLPSLPGRLSAPEPGWLETTGAVVVGSGIAGLTTALHLREAGLPVTVVTKVDVDGGSTRWAQGGIAAVLDPADTPAAHESDTLAAGGGLCDPAAVRLLVTEGPDRIRELIRLGAAFDRHPDGSLMLTREGGHHTDRVVHAGGDATGAEVQRALQAAVRRDPWIRLVEHALVVDLLTAADGRIAGVTLHVLGEGTPDGVGAILAPAVVLATGGMGQVFGSTTNPAASTGDGVALAIRAGAAVTDLEFVQFHPTAFAAPPQPAVRSARPPGSRDDLDGWGEDPAGQQPLVSEALRGEGAYLLDADGKRFLLGQHELAELAPRDVVAKAVHRAMRQAGTDHVWLDARHLGGDFLADRFPTILATCRAAGIDPATEPVPVAPAAHYASGGVVTDLSGRTTVPGLYACGEVACTGVHGANRLASNSLLEGLVFARRIATDLAGSAGTEPPSIDVVEPKPGAGRDAGPQPGAPLQLRARLKRAMSAGAGVLRSAETLAQVAQELRWIGSRAAGGRGTDGWELANLVTVATALVAAAYARRESRGCHWRDDWPEADPGWRGHLRGALRPDGSFTLAWERT